MSTILLTPLVTLNITLAPPPESPLPFQQAHIPIIQVHETSPLTHVDPLQTPQHTLAEELTTITPTVAPRPPIAGNDYVKGQCTWYVKNKRPDLPNSMGNANRWISSARAHGIGTGSEPKVGAVGVNFDYYLGHVVYVESLNPDGTVTISEMNYEGPYIITHRTVPASEFVYIY